MSLKGVLFASGLVCSVTAAVAADCTLDPRLASSRYEINGEQVFDKETKLTWQRCSVGQKWVEGTGCTGAPQRMSLAQAQQLGGPWRLPTKDELSSLLSKACERTTNAEVFPGTTQRSIAYWTSTETAPDLTWIIDLSIGWEFNALRTGTNAAMLVQGPGATTP